MSSENKPDRSIEVRAGGTASRLVEADGCRSSDCPPGASADALNETCYCVTFDVSRLRQSLYTEYGDVFSPTIWARHEHLFATSPVFVDQHSLRRMAMVVAGVAIGGFIVQIVPGIDQVNGDIIALTLPLHLGVVAALLAIVPDQPLPPESR